MFIPFWKEVCSKRKESAPEPSSKKGSILKGRNYVTLEANCLPLKSTPFQNGFSAQETKQKVVSLVQNDRNATKCIQFFKSFLYFRSTLNLKTEICEAYLCFQLKYSKDDVHEQM